MYELKIEMGKSQLEIANERLTELAPNVTESDRRELLKTYSWPTVTRYTKGEGKNLETAMKFFEFLKGRIEKRQELLMTP